ncbi:MAG: TonB-dependent receptor [Saprospiraceae bacterium]|nr:TonB-dependent receptor [Saprospiraceae bacterium]
MKQFLLPLLALVAVFNTVNAQIISGLVQQSNGHPVEFATVTLHKSQDSTLVKGALSGIDGRYEISDATAGTYFLKTTAVGMGSGYSPAFDYDGGDKNMEPIGIAETTTELAQVTVIARRPPIEVKADKTILNVEGTVNSTGLNALELLRKAPGVVVDNNEKVNVKGKNAVKIMIDGREVPLGGKDLSALLKGTQASDISNIEIISNPSAKYDAAGNAGIINIRLKKNKALGTNGNVGLEAIYGESLKGGGNVSLNHRGKDVNVFGSYNGSYGDWHNYQNFVREQNGQRYEQQNKEIWENRYSGYRAGADWYINSKHTVGVLVNGSANPGNWNSNGFTNISKLSSPAQIDTLLKATNSADNLRQDLNTNFNYRFADTSGHSLNFDFDWGNYDLRGASYQPNRYYTADGSELLRERIYRNNTPTKIDIFTVKTDYEQRLFKGTLSVGFKVADVTTDNTFNFYNVVNGESQLDENVSNRFIYDERTTAGYINYNRMFGKKLNIQAGLRAENTDYEGQLLSTKKDTVNTNNYTELFPSAALTYTFNPKMGLNVTYSRRIDRPSYQDLNPFENKLDELTFQRGNPMLRPQFTNSFEISPTYQGYPVITLGYSHTKDVFTQVLKTDTRDTRATFITNENLADQKNYTLSVNLPTPIAKWWEGFVSLTGFRSHFEADFSTPETPDFIVDQSFNAFNLYSEQTVKLPKGFSVQLSGWYNSRAFWGTLRSTPQGSMDLGIQKKLFDGKGEVRLRFGDILHTAGWGGENLFTPNLKMTANGRWESRTVTMNFSYRFGSSEVKAARQRKTGLEDENKRVKGRG